MRGGNGRKESVRAAVQKNTTFFHTLVEVFRQFPQKSVFTSQDKKRFSAASVFTIVVGRFIVKASDYESKPLAKRFFP